MQEPTYITSSGTMTSNASMTVGPDQPAEVHVAHGRVQDAMERLENLIEQTEARFYSVLRPASPPLGDKVPERSPSGVELADGLDLQADRIFAVIARLGDLNARAAV